MSEQFTRRDFLRTAAAATLGTGLQAGEGAAAEKLPHRVLGKTGVRVPILGFGTAPTGIRRNIPTGVSIYNEAIDLGITYFDTAPTHTGYGRAQAQLGHVLKDRRKEVFLVTKCHESGGDDALRLLERNLKELQTDRADLVHVHSLGSLELETALGKNGVLAALLKAKKEGLTRFVGISGHHRPQRFLRVLADFDVDVIMCAVNFADRYTYDFENKVWPAAARENVGLVAMKVFGGMKYSDKGMTNSMMPAQHLHSAFRYALSVPRVSLAVVGMATQEELRRNVQWAKQFKPLTEAERKALAPIGKKLAASWGAHFGAVS
jgi:uncharacterized protein